MDIGTIIIELLIGFVILGITVIFPISLIKRIIDNERQKKQMLKNIQQQLYYQNQYNQYNQYNQNNNNRQM